MKDLFEIYLNVNKIRETISEHNPYMVIAVSSTGVDNSDFKDNYPIGVVAKLFTYSQELNQYSETQVFQKLVKCPPESLQYALDNIDKYNVFEGGAIDKDSYIRGENVLEIEDFKRELTAFFESLPQTTLTVANNYKHCYSMLKKIDCADYLYPSSFEREALLLDISDAVREYFKANSVSFFNAKLGTLDRYLQYNDATIEGDAIKGGINRIKVIDRFISTIGEEEGYINSRYPKRGNLVLDETDVTSIAASIEPETDYTRPVSEPTTPMQAKSELPVEQPISRETPVSARYRDKEYELSLKKLDLSDDILDRNTVCAFNKLLDIYEGKNDAKGFTVLQVATTGYEAGNFPIQFTALCCEMQGGEVTPVNLLSFDIKAPDINVRQALEVKTKTGLDVFAKAGINYDAYSQGKATNVDGQILDKSALKSEEDAIIQIQKFFSRYRPSEYPIISSGEGIKNKNISLSQEALHQIGNVSISDAPFININEIIKQYSYIAYFNPKYPDNAILDEKTWTGNFTVDNASKNANQGEQNHTKLKCGYITGLLRYINAQQNEINEPIKESEKALNEQQINEEQPVFIPVTANKEISPVKEPVIDKAPETDVKAANESHTRPLSERAAARRDFARTRRIATDTKTVSETADFSHIKTEQSLEHFDSTPLYRPSRLSGNLSNLPRKYDEEEVAIDDDEIAMEIMKESASGKLKEKVFEPKLEDLSKPKSGIERSMVINPAVKPDPEYKAKYVRAELPKENSNNSNPHINAEIEKPHIEPQKPAVNNTDNNNLLSVITEQIAAMNNHTKVVEQQNTLLTEFIKLQSQVLAATMEQVIAISKEQRQRETEKEKNDAVSPIDRLESIKDQLYSVINSIESDNAKHNIQKANSYISEGQKCLEIPTEKTERKKD